MNKQEKDFQIVKNILNGAKEDYRKLVDKHSPLVFHIVNEFANDDETAEELAQEIFVKTYERLESFNGQSKFSSWLYMIAKNHCRDYAKNIRRNNKSFNEIDDYALQQRMGSQEAVDTVFEKNEWILLIKQGLDAIKEEYAEAFLMKYDSNMTYRAMSTRLGVSVSALKVRVYRAKKELKEFIEQNS